MRTSTIIAFAASVVGAAAAAVGKQQAQPGCVSKCWDNSQYVSNCAGDQKCLCDDADFQNAMYQCLYSQCQTAQFGLALHHALGMCSESQSAAQSSTVPALLRQGGDLRKRGYNTQSVSNSVAYTRTSSRGSASVSASAYMTYSTSRAKTTSVASATYLTVESVTVAATALVTETYAAPSYTVVTVTVPYGYNATSSYYPSSSALLTSTYAPYATTNGTVTQISDGQVQAAYTTIYTTVTATTSCSDSTSTASATSSSS